MCLLPGLPALCHRLAPGKKAAHRVFTTRWAVFSVWAGPDGKLKNADPGPPALSAGRLLRNLVRVYLKTPHTVLFYQKTPSTALHSLAFHKSSRAECVLRTKQRRHGWRCAPVFASGHRPALRKSAKRKSCSAHAPCICTFLAYYSAFLSSQIHPRVRVPGGVPQAQNPNIV